MDKVKKFLLLPLLCHITLLAALTVMFFAKSSFVFHILVIELVCGAAVAPSVLALVSMIHAIADGGKVYDYIYNCLIIIAVTSLLRLIIYTLLGGGGVGAAVALAAMAVSAGVFTLWDCTFALIDRFMKKSPRRR